MLNLECNLFADSQNSNQLKVNIVIKDFRRKRNQHKKISYWFNEVSEYWLNPSLGWQGLLQQEIWISLEVDEMMSRLYETLLMCYYVFHDALIERQKAN